VVGGSIKLSGDLSFVEVDEPVEHSALGDDFGER